MECKNSKEMDMQLEGEKMEPRYFPSTATIRKDNYAVGKDRNIQRILTS
jgi:hypothetical protein